MNSRQINDYDKATSFIDVFNRLKEIIKNEIHVATLALYKSTQVEYNETLGYGIINVIPFPLNKNDSAILNQCYYFKQEAFTNNQLLIIIYTDIDFKSNLVTNKNKSLTNNNPIMHSKMSAVLISTTNYETTSLTVKNSYGDIIFAANSATNLLTIDASYLTGNINDDVLPNLTAAEGGTDKTVVTTGEKYTWNNKSDFSGDYNDLENKPTIPDPQVQSDWNEADTSKPDYIKNKPTTMIGLFSD